MSRLLKFLALAVATGSATATWADNDCNDRGRYEEMAIARHVISQSGITPDKAIDTAKSTHNGTVYQYELDTDHNRLTYKIKLADPTKSENYEVEIDASNGKVVRDITERNLNAKKNTKTLAAVDAIQKAGFTIKDVIAKVSPAGEPMIKEVEYENRLGLSLFEVETIDAFGKRKILVDIKQKSVIPELKPSYPQKGPNSRGERRPRQ